MERERLRGMPEQLAIEVCGEKNQEGLFEGPVRLGGGPRALANGGRYSGAFAGLSKTVRGAASWGGVAQECDGKGGPREAEAVCAPAFCHRFCPRQQFSTDDLCALRFRVELARLTSGRESFRQDLNGPAHFGVARFPSEGKTHGRAR